MLSHNEVDASHRVPCPDYWDNGDERVDIQDIVAFLAPVRYFGGPVGTAPQFDRDIDGDIDIQDLISVIPFMGEHCAQVNFWMKMTSLYDPYNGGLTNRTFANAHYRGGLVFPPASNSGGSYDKAWFSSPQVVYLDVQRIEFNTSKGVTLAHGVNNAAGEPCYYRWTDDHMANPGNLAYRTVLIAYLTALFAAQPHYDGIYLDDMQLNIDQAACGSLSESLAGTGCSAPDADNCPVGYTETTWARAWAELAESIRAAFPSLPIVHNSQPRSMPIGNPEQERQIRAADVIEIEHGFVNTWVNTQTLWAWMDYIHGLDRAILHQSYRPNHETFSDSERIYGLAAYLLGAESPDAFATFRNAMPDNWWDMYEVDLGFPTGARYLNGSVWRRDFERGYVTVNTSSRVAAIVEGG